MEAQGGSPIVRVINETTSQTFDALSNLSLAASAGVGSGAAGTVVTDSGVVADGYISGARVFRDADEDGAFDAGETLF